MTSRRVVCNWPLAETTKRASFVRFYANEVVVRLAFTDGYPPYTAGNTSSARKPPIGASLRVSLSP